jgi:hypothetical protein
MNTVNVLNHNRKVSIALGLAVMTLCGLWQLPTLQVRAAVLENQWRSSPDIRVKPEGGGSARPLPVGGNSWTTAAQDPVYVPVKLWLNFKASNCRVTGTLGWGSVWADVPFPVTGRMKTSHLWAIQNQPL